MRNQLPVRRPGLSVHMQVALVEGKTPWLQYCSNKYFVPGLENSPGRPYLGLPIKLKEVGGHLWIVTQANRLTPPPVGGIVESMYFGEVASDTTCAAAAQVLLGQGPKGSSFRPTS